MAQPDHAALALRPDVGGEDLEAREAGADGLGYLRDDIRRDGALEHDVKRVVRVALSPDLLLLGDGLGEAHPRLPDGEVRERRRAAEEGGGAHLARPRAQRHTAVAGGDRPARVHMGVDAARDDQLAGRVDHAGTLRRQRARGGDGDDALAIDADVPRPHALGGDHLPTANEEIEHASLR